MIGWSIFIFVTLIAAALKRNFEAGLLPCPARLSFVGIVEPVITAGMSDETGSRLPFAAHPPGRPNPHSLCLHRRLHWESWSLCIIIFVRFLRVQRDQERVTSELAAARSVQELMIPQEKLQTPGFEVDSIYNPANEVGGDFFHVETVGSEACWW